MLVVKKNIAVDYFSRIYVVNQISRKRVIPKIFNQIMKIYTFKNGKFSFNFEEEEKFLHDSHNILTDPGISKDLFIIKNYYFNKESGIKNFLYKRQMPSLQSK